jgi:hypothetical protein
VPLSIYGMSTRFDNTGSSVGDTGASTEGVVEGGLTRGLPANGVLEEIFDSVLRCERLGVAIIGILLLDGSGGRFFSDGAITFAAVSDLFKLPNLDGGAGRDPVGRVNLLRRPLR